MQFQETKTEIYEADDKTSLLAHVWLPEGDVKAVIIGIHGAMTHGGDFVTPALYFNKKGYAFYALDLRWHGTFDKYNDYGKVILHINDYEEYVNDIHAYFHLLRKEYPRLPIFIMAHSNGGLIALKYGLTRAKETDIAGFIISSPWLKNMVKVSPVVVALSKFIAKVAPMFAVPPEPLNDKVTRDQEITKRHYEDEAKGLRSTKVTAKFGHESMKNQDWVINNVKNWEQFPVFAAIAGQDFLADPEASKIAFSQMPAHLVNLNYYPENYHENFNEINREEIFAKIVKWMESVGAKKGVAKGAVGGRAGAKKPAAKAKAAKPKAKPKKK